MTQHPVCRNAKVWPLMWEYALKVEDLPAFEKHFMTVYVSRDEYLAMITDQTQTNTPSCHCFNIQNIFII